VGDHRGITIRVKVMKVPELKIEFGGSESISVVIIISGGLVPILCCTYIIFRSWG